jgi:hypothetical protein
MATTCRLIAKNTLGSDAADVTFSSIPGTYTDLLLVANARTARALLLDVLKLEFNGSTTGYSSRYLEGAGASGVASATISEFWGLTTAGDNATASTFGNSECYIPNYAGSTNKSASSTGTQETNGTTAYIQAQAALWTSTDAITSIKIVSRVGSNIRSGSSFFLYGITKA